MKITREEMKSYINKLSEAFPVLNKSKQPSQYFNCGIIPI